MQIKDEATRYGLVSRALHWSMAGLFGVQIFGMGLKLVLGRHPLVAPFVQSHATLGLLLLGLAVARALWALCNLGRRPAQGAGGLGLAAKAGHGLLYGLMLAVPLLALLRAWGASRPLNAFGREIFAGRETEIGFALGLGDALHGPLGWLLALAIAGHIAMVGLHHWRWRDGTLARMWGR